MVCQEIINRERSRAAAIRVRGWGWDLGALGLHRRPIEYSIALHDKDRKFNSHLLTFTGSRVRDHRSGDIILQKK